jgi:Cu-Zn family superoxide dismutase
VTLTPRPTSLVGHAQVIHSGKDDYVTQPTGNSGGRIACGVIVAN